MCTVCPVLLHICRVLLTGSAVGADLLDCPKGKAQVELLFVMFVMFVMFVILVL